MFAGCNTCGLTFIVHDKPEAFRILEDPKWAGGFPCPARACPGVLVRGKPTSSSPYVEVNVGGFYRAIHGLGFGQSVGAAPEQVHELLLNGKVVSAELRPIGGDAKRTIVDNITFEDGTIMHFASSNEGACVFLVESGEDFNASDSLAAVGDSQDSSEDRAQARHHRTGQEGAGGRVPGDSPDGESERGPSVGSAGEVHPGSTAGPHPTGNGS